MKRNNFPVKALIRIFLSQFYIWSLLLLDGCASLPVIEDEVKSGQKAVILTIGYTLSPLYRSNFMLMSAEWTNQEAKANFSTAETCFSRACKTIQVFSVKPGIYSLSKLTFDSHAEGYSADIPSDFASFEVKGGEVVYIGDVFFDARDTKIIVAGLEILDSLKEAQSVFAQQYPRCLVPECDGVLYEKLPSKEELWGRYCMEAPKRQRQYVERYSIVKKA